MRKNLHLIIISFILAIVVWTLISLSYEYTTELSFELHITAAGRNLSPAPEGKNKIQVKCRATGWKLLRLMFTEGNEYSISSERNFDRDSVAPERYMDQNQWLTAGVTVISISPEKIKVNVEAVRKKKVAVSETGVFKFKEGYGFAGKPEIIPDSVEITGAASVINGIQWIGTTGEVNDILEDKTELTRKLDIPAGVQANLTEVKVVLPVQQIVDKEFTAIPVDILGVPKDRNVLLNPGVVNVSVRGGIEVISRLKNEDFIIHYDYSALVRDSSGLFQPEPKTTAPVEVLMTNPRYIRFIIKKY